ncbi:hypothetical protein [Cellulomonas endophytica]|uniref:hypothetical protein n=1 Tax=Cellulomonas endophytica TaxID=2494735 RepID=UPI0010113EB8|nr:hypothetical protein [Cellulomonas endophytica]
MTSGHLLQAPSTCDVERRPDDGGRLRVADGDGLPAVELTAAGDGLTLRAADERWRMPDDGGDVRVLLRPTGSSGSRVRPRPRQGAGPARGLCC